MLVQSMMSSPRFPFRLLGSGLFLSGLIGVAVCSITGSSINGLLTTWLICPLVVLTLAMMLDRFGGPR